MPADNENQLYRKIWTAGNKSIFCPKKDCICWSHSKKKKKHLPFLSNSIQDSRKETKIKIQNHSCISSVLLPSDIFIDITAWKEKNDDIASPKKIK